MTEPAVIGGRLRWRAVCTPWYPGNARPCTAVIGLSTDTVSAVASGARTGMHTSHMSLMTVLRPQRCDGGTDLSDGDRFSAVWPTVMEPAVTARHGPSPLVRHRLSPLVRHRSSATVHHCSIPLALDPSLPRTSSNRPSSTRHHTVRHHRTVRHQSAVRHQLASSSRPLILRSGRLPDQIARNIPTERRRARGISRINQEDHIPEIEVTGI